MENSVTSTSLLHPPSVNVWKQVTITSDLKFGELWNVVLKANDEDSLDRQIDQWRGTKSGVERKLIGEIRTRQLRFLGHVIRKDGLENLAWLEEKMLD